MSKSTHVITATFRIVTPMFLAGADQSAAELRAPSIKGALRFWWRALAWQRCGNNLEELRRQESTLFGSSDDGQSKVLLRVLNPAPRPTHRSRFQKNSWQGYSGYGLFENLPSDSRDVFSSGAEFRLELNLQRCMPNQCIEVRDALVLFGLIGGLGGRSRKGWGSVTLESLVEPEMPDWLAPRSAESYQREFLRLQKLHDPISYTTLSAQSRIEISPMKATSDEAHRWLIDRYRKAVSNVDPKKKKEREEFGLPRESASPVHRRQRRASALFLHVHQPSGVQALPVIAFLPANFLPDALAPSGEWRHARALLDGVHP